MKKVTKKHLIIMFVVAVLATVMAFCVSAADENLGVYNCPDCKLKVDATYGEVIEPQCESYGYTPVICPICKYEFKEAKVVAKLGHSETVKEYVLDETGAYYQKNLRCGRSGCNYGLKETIVELRAGAEVKYCKVSFTNDFVAVKFEDDGFCSYTTLVKSDDPETLDVDESIGAYKSDTEVKYIEYPAKDSSVVVTPKAKPVRLADRVFGEYTFKGWLTKEEISQIYAESNLMPIDLSYDANEIFKNDISYDQTNKQFVYPTVYKGQDYFDALSRAAQEKTSAEKASVVITADTPADYSLYAIFNAETNLRHEVTFHKYNGEPIKTYYVPHGATITFDKDTPKKPSNAEYNYEFACWVVYGTEKEVSNGHKVYPVYDSIHVEPYFDYTIRQYTFKYYKTGGK
ncbi:MAG: hypothetical protein IKY78_07930, partial [Clostridia bacterium]|nr:hypothetical protein [Clostridia bacterium]